MSTFTLAGQRKRIVFTIEDGTAYVARGTERITTTVEQARVWYKRYIDRGYTLLRNTRPYKVIFTPDGSCVNITNPY